MVTSASFLLQLHACRTPCTAYLLSRFNLVFRGIRNEGLDNYSCHFCNMAALVGHARQLALATKDRSVQIIDNRLPPKRRSELFSSLKSWASANPRIAVCITQPQHNISWLTSLPGIHTRPYRPLRRPPPHLPKLYLHNPPVSTCNMPCHWPRRRPIFHSILRWRSSTLPRAHVVLHDVHRDLGLRVGRSRLFSTSTFQCCSPQGTNREGRAAIGPELHQGAGEGHLRPGEG